MLATGECSNIRWGQFGPELFTRLFANTPECRADIVARHEQMQYCAVQ